MCEISKILLYFKNISLYPQKKKNDFKDILPKSLYFFRKKDEFEDALQKSPYF